MLAMVQKIINGLGEELHNVNFKHACLTQKIETMKHLTIIQSFVQKYEHTGKKTDTIPFVHEENSPIRYTVHTLCYMSQRTVYD